MIPAKIKLWLERPCRRVNQGSNSGSFLSSTGLEAARVPKDDERTKTSHPSFLPPSDARVLSRSPDVPGPNPDPFPISPAAPSEVSEHKAQTEALDPHSGTYRGCANAPSTPDPLVPRASASTLNVRSAPGPPLSLRAPRRSSAARSPGAKAA